MNSFYNYILFDLDGTLTDSARGIMNGVIYAVRGMGRQLPAGIRLQDFIGPPLKESFNRILGYSQEDSDRAVSLYRDYYNNKGGAVENSVFSGVYDMLSELKTQGKKLIIATSKPSLPANTVLEHFDLKKYFDYISTSDDNIRPYKSDVILFALKECGITELTQCVMVGDREYDISAAKEIGISSIGVLYGYGDRTELTNAGATYLAESVFDVKRILLGSKN